MSIFDRFVIWILPGMSKSDKDELRKHREQCKSKAKSVCRTSAKECLVTIGNNARLDSLGYHGKLDSINALKMGWSINVYFEVDRISGVILSAKAVPHKNH